MEAICTEQANAWLDPLRTIEKQKVARDAAWVARRVELAARKAQVMELIDRKIKAAQELADAVKEVKQADGASPAETPAQKEARVKEEAAEAEKGKKAAQEEKDRLAAVQAVVDRRASMQAEARKAFKQLNTTATITKSDLVDMTKLKSSEASTKVQATMYYWARASAMGDAHLPYTFTDMSATVKVAQELVGEAVWKTFFKDSAITDGDVCPMQLRQVMFLQLMILDQDLRKKVNAGQEAIADKLLEDAEPRLKKLRTMLN